MNLWRRDRFPFDEVVTHYEFGESHESVADAGAGDTIKPVLNVSSL